MYAVFFTPDALVDCFQSSVEQTGVVLTDELPPLRATWCRSVDWLPAGPVRLELEADGPATAFHMPPSWVLFVVETKAKERGFGFLAASPAKP